MIIYLCRHAKEARYPYKPQEAITDLGKKQALALGQYLSDKDIEALYTSDMPRALRTAEIVGKALNLKPKILGELREISVDLPRGWTDYIERLHPDFDYLLSGRESLNMLIERGKRAWGIITSENKGKNVVVIGHGIFTKALLYHFGYEDHLMKNDPIPPTGVTILEYTKDQPKLIAFAKADHLRGAWLKSRLLSNLLLSKILRR